MSKLTSKKRGTLKKTVFAIPSERKYPITDKTHAINAKARSTQMMDKGVLNKAMKQKIDAKANKLLKKLKVRKTKLT